MRLRGESTTRDAVAYIAVQVVAAVAGVMLAHAMFDLPLIQPGTHARTGLAQWLSEAVATFGLLLTILLGVRHRPGAVPALVASYIFAAYWFTASTSFANPAVTIARSLTQTFAGIRLLDVPGFVIAQALARCSRWSRRRYCSTPCATRAGRERRIPSSFRSCRGYRRCCDRASQIACRGRDEARRH